MIKVISAFAVLMLCFLPVCFGNPPGYQRITAETAYQMMQRGTAGSRELGSFVLLDVRSEAEFREKRIAGAILIPVNELERRAATELPDKNAVILVYCRAGVRASNAARILAGRGYTQVFNFGGIMDWPYETASGNF